MPQTFKYLAAIKEQQQQVLDNSGLTLLRLAKSWLTIEKDLEKNLILLLEEIGPNIPTRSQLFQLSRAQALLGQVVTTVNGYNAQVGLPAISSSLASTALKGIENAYGIVSASTVVPYSRLPVGAVTNILAQAAAGQPLDVLLKPMGQIATEGIIRQLTTGAAYGVNPKVTARAMLRNGLSPSLQHAMVLSRDQTIRAYREATRQQYKATGVVSQYQRLAAKNIRTCVACIKLDGKVYDIDETIELHPQDRCTIIPLVDGQPAPKFETGAAWFSKQSANVQRQILGDRRYSLFESGEAGLDDLVTIGHDSTWGPTARPRSIGSLARAYG